MNEISSSSSSDSDMLSFSDSETEATDLTTLRPYDMEPEFSSGESNDSDNDDYVTDHFYDETEHLERIGNTDWCNCKCCRPMTTFQESICCKEEVPIEYFSTHTCITEHEDFRTVCTNPAVLRTTLSALNHLRGDIIAYENNSLRYAGYRQFTWWIHNRLGKGVRRVIPSCAIWAIRDMYPDANNNYVPFLEAREEENRLL